MPASGSKVTVPGGILPLALTSRPRGSGGPEPQVTGPANPRPPLLRGRRISPSERPASSLPELGAQERQYLLGIELQETRLVGAGSMNDQVGEAELDIGPDLGERRLG